MPRRSAYETNGDADDIAVTAQRLTKSGFLTADSPDCFRDGLNLLVAHLRAEAVPPREILAQRIQNYADRPRPYMASQRSWRGSTFTAWINPRRILLKERGTRSFIHDNSNATRQTRTTTGQPNSRHVEPLASLPEFAERIAYERGAPAGLTELFGDPETPAIQVEAWKLPIGPLFRIETSGNHRLAALAALAVPCVLAEVRLHTGLFDTSQTSNLDEMDEIEAYRRLLQTFEIASFTDTGMLAVHGIATRWPMLIRDPETAVKSLTAVEQITGAPITHRIGQLPRSWFGGADEIRAASRDIGDTLDRFIVNRSRHGIRRFYRRKSSGKS
ncbi:hypothetical protein D7D52_34765 [Nocardia yunnanensis]|uniref:Uncharacterized protein n=1 Tax=Nocardia yunnanensis TaxID=2382165 RepID=A0A386ZNJ5_9NOCA|nr:hypothetical protein [Nocardia yunnanensis]AYF78135.1 hypothetical protein D7D52_34765 [Nocardia yunnanensis]